MTQLLLSELETEPTSDAEDDGSPPQPVPTELSPAQGFLDALLAALTQMAVLSPRRQADVAVAMRRAGLCARPELVQGALDRLQREGSVERPLHLSDGGILVSVTMRGIERLASTAHRHVVVAMMGPARG